MSSEPPVPPLNAEAVEKLMADVMNDPDLIQTIPDEYVDQLLAAFGVSQEEITLALRRFRATMLRDTPTEGNA